MNEDAGAKVVLGSLIAIVAVPVALFLAGAWRDAKAQHEETMNPPFRWTDKNRWE